MAQSDFRRMVARKPAVLFDLFHTLTDVGSRWIEGPTTADVLGVSPAAWTEQLLVHSPERVVGIERDPVRMITKMARALDATISDETIARAVDNRLARFKSALMKIPEDNLDTLRGLKAQGKKIGLISNADVSEVLAWDKSPLAPFFDSVIFSCHAACAKPDARIYELSLRELDLSPDDALFVGDGGSGELQGARDVGLVTVMMTGVIKHTWPEVIDERRSQCDFVVERLTELL